MGTVHKFKRPPKNQGQFKGYRPGAPGGGKPPGRGSLWSRMRPWQRSLAAWAVLIAIAAGIVGTRALLAG